MNETNQENVADNEIVEIEYWDRINKEKVILKTTKEIADFEKNSEDKIKNDDRRFKRKTLNWDKVFNEDHPENDKYLEAPNSNPEEQYFKKMRKLMQKTKKEHLRTLVENALCCLTPEQREVIDLIFYEDMAERKIGRILGISQQAVHARKENAIENLKNYIFNTQN